MSEEELAPPALAPLPRAFYARPTAAVARDLIGKVLVREWTDAASGAGSESGARRVVRGRIVEVEAYLGERDAASHARRGPTPRAAIMFGPPGFLYVYLIYGMHSCMNFVSHVDGVAGAVLIRAAEPLAAGAHTNADADMARARPMSGPGKLCAAFGITTAAKGSDLTAPAPGGLYVADPGGRPPRRAVSPRIGIDYAGDWAARKLRWYVPGNPHVSGKPR